MIATPAAWPGYRIRLIVCLPLIKGRDFANTLWEVCSMARYVVTGGGGFIGSHIVEELVRRNEAVTVIDNFSTGKHENVEPFEDDVDVIEADIAEAKNLTQFLKGADYVIHQAAIPSVPKSI